MRHALIPMLMMVASAAAVPERLRAASYVHDDFDDGALGTEWQVSFHRDAPASNAWSYYEAGTELVVTDVVDTHARTEDTDSEWGEVRLSQSFTPLGDFSADVSLGWDSGASDPDRAMQVAYLVLADSSGDSVAVTGYHDAWGRESGELVSGIAQNWKTSGADSAPYTGSAVINVTRTGDAISVLIDGQEFHSDVSDRPICELQLRFQYWLDNRVDPPSHFGTETIDVVSLSGSPIPEPATLTLLALGGLAVMGRRRR